MLVEINLLPKKERKRKSQLLWVILAFLITFLLIGLFIWQYMTKKAELAATENSLKMTTNLIDTYNQRLESYKSSESVQSLESAIKWANNQSVDYVLFLQELTKNLPERGFIQELKVSDDYKTNMIVQFDTKSDAAYYLNSLLEISWIDDALLTEGKSTDALENKISDQVDQVIDNLKQSEVEPRYFASYEFVLNKAKLRDETEKQKDENEKGEDSP
ncbi:hypothetical protein CHH55_19055 [Niallia circulans]|uniref:Fimbrial assembly protein n=1 Tax=Niallia circulans TaxID=1397 RepID=A0A0J1IEZ0_NIACI|nr:hypothetical protein [Niallia circulans]KLV24511.1 hypothetical protein ABW02_17655 [Niallia circulans]MCM2980575.1 fimbrial assembly protein [Niallia circulans]MDR4317751.1 fimbrial assembly protein [Niallia circulans]MED3841534.1 fimbrial assembly protein [Niallia circulans]MED4243270.1 fimbrial assembly protein [Niallia circulans]